MSAEIWWRLTKPVSRPVPASGPRADPDRDRARVLSAIALASVAAGAINVAAAALAGGLAQADAFGSSPAGSGQNGTSGVNDPYAPGTSGGGTSGGGYPGGGY